MELMRGLDITVTMATALFVFHLLGEVIKELVRVVRPNYKPNWKRPPLKRDGYSAYICFRSAGGKLIILKCL